MAPISDDFLEVSLIALIQQVSMIGNMCSTEERHRAALLLHGKSCPHDVFSTLFTLNTWPPLLGSLCFGQRRSPMSIGLGLLLRISTAFLSYRPAFPPNKAGILSSIFNKWYSLRMLHSVDVYSFPCGMRSQCNSTKTSIDMYTVTHDTPWPVRLATLTVLSVIAYRDGQKI